MNVTAQGEQSRGQLNGDLLTVEEVAAILKVKKSWVYEHLRSLPHVRLGRYVRFEPQTITEYIRGQRKGYVGPKRYQ
jgi:excisionase family DNA binding protein